MPRPRSHLPLVTLRPRERVEAFLHSAMRQGRWKVGGRLPTNRELAAKLGVSVPTVRAALEKFAREGRVRSRSGSGTFLVSARGGDSGEVHALVCCFGVSEQARDVWAGPIYSGIFQAAGRQHPPVALRCLAAEAEPDRLVQHLLEQRKKLDGLILFPAVLAPPEARARVVAAWEEEGKPVVSLNPPSAFETANFVSADYFGSAVLLGEAWRKSGRKRALLVFHGEFASSPSSNHRFLGLKAGFSPAGGAECPVDFLERTGPTEADGHEAGRRILAGPRPLPDAIFCGGDFLALGLCRALREAGVKVPEQVSVVGGTGMNPVDSASSGLTRTQHPLGAIGAGLLGMLVARVRGKGAPVPGRYLPMPFAGGGTTRPEENALLGISRAH